MDQWHYQTTAITGPLWAPNMYPQYAAVGFSARLGKAVQTPRESWWVTIMIPFYSLNRQGTPHHSTQSGRDKESYSETQPHLDAPPTHPFEEPGIEQATLRLPANMQALLPEPLPPS